MPNLSRDALAAAFAVLLMLMSIARASADEFEFTFDSDAPANNEVYPYVPAVIRTDNDGNGIDFLPGLNTPNNAGTGLA